jgi:hypothetical protein
MQKTTASIARGMVGGFSCAQACITGMGRNSAADYLLSPAGRVAPDVVWPGVPAAVVPVAPVTEPVVPSAPDEPAAPVDLSIFFDDFDDLPVCFIGFEVVVSIVPLVAPAPSLTMPPLVVGVVVWATAKLEAAARMAAAMNDFCMVIS